MLLSELFEKFIAITFFRTSALCSGITKNCSNNHMYVVLNVTSGVTYHNFSHYQKYLAQYAMVSCG